eukprot:1745509-Prymnesium_polylepis.1
MEMVHLHALFVSHSSRLLAVFTRASASEALGGLPFPLAGNGVRWPPPTSGRRGASFYAQLGPPQGLRKNSERRRTSRLTPCSVWSNLKLGSPTRTRHA